MLVATTAEGRGAGRCWTVLFSGPRRQDGGAAGTNMVHCELGYRRPSAWSPTRAIRWPCKPS